MLWSEGKYRRRGEVRLDQELVLSWPRKENLQGRPVGSTGHALHIIMRWKLSPWSCAQLSLHSHKLGNYLREKDSRAYILSGGLRPVLPLPSLFLYFVSLMEE